MNGSLQQADRTADTDDHSSLTAAVRMAAAGDRCAFEGLIERFQGEIFRMVYYRTSSRMDAEDITQEVFINAFRGVHSLKDPGMFRSWLYRIALNGVRDYYRKKRVRSIFTLFSREHNEEHVPDKDSGQEHGQDRLERKEFWDGLDRFMSRLSASEREVFRLKYLDDLSIREITEVLGKNESTVKTHLYRAVDKFRKEQDVQGFLKGENYEYE